MWMFVLRKAQMEFVYLVGELQISNTQFNHLIQVHALTM